MENSEKTQDVHYKPRLRPVEAFELPDDDGDLVGVRDATGLSDIALTLSPAALHVLAMMDGSRSLDDIRSEFQETVGVPIALQTLRSMIEKLDEAHFLEGEDFEHYYQSLLATYRESGVRALPQPEILSVWDPGGTFFDDCLAQADRVNLPGPVIGLVAPHLDYPRGRPCYASAYVTLKDRPVPDTIVILGTNHFGRSSSVVATGSDFETPLGVSVTNVAFIEELEFRCGSLRAFEYDHMREHSIELQVIWLQHLFGCSSFSIVPILCPDPCGPTGTAPYDGCGVDLEEFAVALREVMADSDADTLVVAGADLSHVGEEFGDERQLDEAFLNEVRGVDEGALESLQSGGPEAFVDCLARNENPTRVCSAGCIYVLAQALPSAKATLLAYHQAVDQSTQTCVTCAAMAFARNNA